MAIIIERAPVDYSSIHGDLYYNIYEGVKATDIATYPDYKYVADIYVMGVKIATQKASPHPLNNRGIFNIGPIVRSYVQLVFDPLPGQLVVQQLATVNFRVSVQVKFGEEYGGVMTTNLTLDTNRDFYNHYNGRLINKKTILPDYLNKFATNRPADNFNNVRVGSEYVFIPYLSIAPGDIAFSIAIYSGYNSTSSVTFDYYLPIDFGTTGGSQSISTFNTTVNAVQGNSIIQLNVSPAIINLLWPGAINDNTAYYIIRVGDAEFRFNLYCEAIYNPRTIHFINQLGGVESFEFSKLSRSKLAIEKKGIGIHRANLHGDTYSNITLNSNYKNYSTKFNEKITLNSSNIKQGQYKWLAEMVLSPQKWIEQDGFLVPITFTNTDYDFKSDINDRASKILTVEVDFNEDLNTQYL